MSEHPELRSDEVIARLASLEEHFDDVGLCINADAVEDIASYVKALAAELADVKAMSGYQRSLGYDEGYKAGSAARHDAGGEW